MNGIENGQLRIFTAEECKTNKWEGQVVRYYRNPTDDGNRVCSCGKRMHDHGWLDQGDWSYVVCPGDWIVTAEANFYAVVRDEAFQQVYEEDPTEKTDKLIRTIESIADCKVDPDYPDELQKQLCIAVQRFRGVPEDQTPQML